MLFYLNIFLISFYQFHLYNFNNGHTSVKQFGATIKIVYACRTPISAPEGYCPLLNSSEKNTPPASAEGIGLFN